MTGEHIPATKGDVTLRGHLYKRYEGEELGVYNSDDMPVAFYTNHINLTFGQRKPAPSLCSSNLKNLEFFRLACNTFVTHRVL